MILASRGANVRALEFGSSAVPPPGSSGSVSYTGRYMAADQMFGLPAVMAAIRLIAETIASFDLYVCRGRNADKRHATSTWQWQLLQHPCQEQSLFDWLADMTASVEGFGNAFCHKIKSKGRVVELKPLDPDYVRARRDKSTLEKVFDVSLDGRTTVTLTANEILHIRGFTPRAASVAGVAPVTMFRNPLGFASALEEFAGRFFKNDATPGGVIQIPGSLTKVQATEMLENWSDQRAGVRNSHRPAILYNGAAWQSIGVNMLDAEWVAASQHSIEDIARIFRIPAEFLEAGPKKAGASVTTEQEGLRLLMLSVQPRTERITSALAADPDLFGNTDLYPEFNTQSLLRADAVSQATVDKEAIQSGWKTPDEVRADHGLPPLPNGAGAIPQITPVGGAPNPQMDAYQETEPAPRVYEAGLARPVGFDILDQLQTIFRPEIRVDVPTPVVSLQPQVTVDSDMDGLAVVLSRLADAAERIADAGPPQITNEILVQSDEVPDYPPTVVPKTVTVQRDDRTGLVKSLTVD